MLDCLAAMTAWRLCCSSLSLTGQMLPRSCPLGPAVAVLSKGFCPTAVAAVPPSKAVEGGVSDAALYGVAPVSAGPAAALYGVASVSAGPAAVLSDDSGLCSTPAASQAAASAT